MTSPRPRLPRLLASTIVAAGAVVCPLRADVAHLKNGQALEVSGYRMDGERIVLLIDGGGEMTLPATHVLTIEHVSKDGLPRPPALPPASGPSGERLVARPGTSVPLASGTLGGVAPGATTGSGTSDPPIVIPAGAIPDRPTLEGIAARTARKYRVEERLVLAVIEVESRYDAFAVSPRGAIGLMQLMPETAVRFDVKNPYDPVANIDGGVRYLKELLDRYSGQRRLALAAYNAGEEAVERFSGIPPYRETVLYVDRVLRALRR